MGTEATFVLVETFAFCFFLGLLALGHSKLFLSSISVAAVKS